ncbi:hypothetical protein ACFQMA_25090 [Halosimplex aquaticum]|uniref:DUF1440 domain-containing protein n=1 Tax=Halosimplex aquaticum TaxID=3026162 RepID=A0ABD5Y6M3_9EURY
MSRAIPDRRESDAPDGQSAPAGRTALAGRTRRGLEGGLLATLVMTVYRLPITRSLPPTADFWAQFVGDGAPEDYPVPALVLHFAYGGTAGAVFAASLRGRESVDPDEPGYDRRRGPPTYAGEVPITVAGLLYGLVLSAVGEQIVLGRLLDVDPDDRVAFHVGHVLYGITLGAWVGTRTTDRE